MTTGYTLTNSNGVVIADIVNWIPKTRRNKVSGYTYGGAFYQQTVGAVSTVIIANLRVYSQADLVLVNLAEANGEILTALYNGTTYSVYLDGEVTWTAAVNGKIYNGKCKLAVVTT